MNTLGSPPVRPGFPVLTRTLAHLEPRHKLRKEEQELLPSPTST